MHRIRFLCSHCGRRLELGRIRDVQLGMLLKSLRGAPSRFLSPTTCRPTTAPNATRLTGAHTTFGKGSRRAYILIVRTPPCFRCVTNMFPLQRGSTCSGNAIFDYVAKHIARWTFRIVCCQPVGPCLDCCHCGPQRWNFHKQGAPHGQCLRRGARRRGCLSCISSASGSNELARDATRARTERLEQSIRSCFFPMVSLVLART